MPQLTLVTLALLWYFVIHNSKIKVTLEPAQDQNKSDLCCLKYMEDSKSDLAFS